MTDLNYNLFYRPIPVGGEWNMLKSIIASEAVETRVTSTVSEGKPRFFR